MGSREERSGWEGGGRLRVSRAHPGGSANGCPGLSGEPSLASCPYPRIVHTFGYGGYKADWTRKMQGSSQIFGLLLTLAMALVGGIIVGESERLD